MNHNDPSNDPNISFFAVEIFSNGSEFRQKLIGTIFRVLRQHLQTYSGIKHQTKTPMSGASHQSPVFFLCVFCKTACSLKHCYWPFLRVFNISQNGGSDSNK